MNNSIIRFFITVALGMFGSMAYAQDPHFSQFYNTPMLTNPANTGFYNEDYRVGLNYREQWPTIPAPYTTIGGFGDIRLSQQDHPRDIFGLGFVLFNDKAGDVNLSYTTVGASFAYHHALDRFCTQFISVGVILNAGTETFNYSNAIFGSSLQSGSVFTLANPNKSFFDVGLGGRWSSSPRHRRSYYIGVADYHINQPATGLVGNGATPMKFTLDAGMEFPSGSKLDIYPKLYAAFQGAHHEVDAGALFHVKVQPGKKEKYAVYVGGWYRVGDAFVPAVSMDAYNLRFTFSYDVNLSKLNVASNFEGGPELSIIFMGKIHGASHVGGSTPRF